LKAASVKRQQPLPVPLGGGLVEAPPARKSKAVVDTRIDFQLSLGAGFLE
jgi:hypothetical protein